MKGDVPYWFSLNKRNDRNIVPPKHTEGSRKAKVKGAGRTKAEHWLGQLEMEMLSKGIHTVVPCMGDIFSVIGLSRDDTTSLPSIWLAYGGLI